MGNGLKKFRRHFKSAPRFEGLETRALCAVGLGPTAAPVSPSAIEYYELGNVTQAVTTVGAQAVVSVAAHEAVGFQFELSVDADYILYCRYTGGPVSITAAGPNGVGTIYPAGPNVNNILEFHLPVGKYTFTATALGDQSVFVDWELIIASGLGQGAAQSAQLVATNVVDSSLTQVTPGSSGSTTVATSAVANPAPASVSIPTPAWSGLVAQSVLVGRPSTEADHVMVVGPVTEDGSAATASVTNGLTSNDDPRRALSDQADDPVVVAINGAMTSETTLALSTRGDDIALSASERVERGIALVAGPLQNFMPTFRETRSEDADTHVAIATTPAASSEDVAEPTDDLSSSTVRRASWLLPITAVALRYRFRPRRKPSFVARTVPAPRLDAKLRTKAKKEPTAGNATTLPRWQRNSMLDPQRAK